MFNCSAAIIASETQDLLGPPREPRAVRASKALKRLPRNLPPGATSQARNVMFGNHAH